MVANPELGYRYQHQGYQTPETRRLMLVDRQGKVNYILNSGGGRGNLRGGGYSYQHQGYKTPETRRLMLINRQGKVKHTSTPRGGGWGV